MKIVIGTNRLFIDVSLSMEICLCSNSVYNCTFVYACMMFFYAFVYVKGLSYRSTYIYFHFLLCKSRNSDEILGYGIFN